MTATEPAPAPAEAPRESSATEPDDARIMDDAWRDIIATSMRGESLTQYPIAAVLLAAITGRPYEGAEMDPPSVAVLRAVRSTVEGWARSQNGRTLFAAVPFGDLELLTRRVDVAIALVKHSPGGVR